MTKTIEVGRAVLTSSAHHQELWLRTLIIISSSQPSIDLEELAPYTILSLLSSGNVWIDCGYGMRIEIRLTWRGETFPQRELQELMNNILQAPVSSLSWIGAYIKELPNFDSGVVSIEAEAHHPKRRYASGRSRTYCRQSLR
jgi:hypothetical protein